MSLPHPLQSTMSQHHMPPLPQPIMPLWWHPHPITLLLPTTSLSLTTSPNTMSTGQLDTPAWITLAMPTLPTLSSAAPPSPSPPACTLTLNLAVRRIASATTEETDLREPASSAPTEHSSINTCSGVSSGTQSTAAQPSPSTASTPTPCSTRTCPSPSWTSMATPSQWWPTLTLTMGLFTTLLLTMLLLTMPWLLSTMPWPTTLPPLPTTQLPTMQLPSTTPHPSIPWQSPTTPLPSMLHLLPTMQFTMTLQQFTMRLLHSIMLLPLSMQSPQSAMGSHLSPTLESRQCWTRVKNHVIIYLFIHSVEYNS